MNREALMKILPHRDDMLLLDEATLQEDSAVGSYRVRGDEFFLRGHFPGNPVVPGVILLEILAQSACVLMQNQMTEGKTPYYTGLDKVRFRNPVRPGEVISTECRLIRAKPPFYFAEGKAMVGDKLCAKAEFSFTIMGE